MQDIVLYGCGTTRTLRVHWVLNELGLTYRSIDFPPGSEYASSLEYKKVNSTGKVPSLTIDKYVLFESAAICLFLSDCYGSHGNDIDVFEMNSVNRAKLYQWCFFAMTELDAHTLYVLNKHGGKLKNIYGESETAVRTAKKGFENQIIKMDDELSDGRRFIIKDSFSVADILLGTCIESALNLDLKPPLKVPDRCIKYWDELKKRDAYLKAHQRNYRYLS